ncbi:MULTISPECIES: DUF6894 family protein [unclassified Brevundimonas]|uniref:DUF6894 family protein n=1 Tax=unclassified Brevundimonas TaxID=2622653 RepID=UPI002004BE1D|nr:MULTISPECIES: hypothetical protein [unclassified Brevundimonas]MCK6104230.1 hypothetical protein [Brevundimonas sp. EYE_349]
MRYFFDTIDQTGARRDPIGVDCATATAARRLAREALAEMFVDARDGGDATLVIAVRDAEGSPVFEGRLVYAER